MARIVSNGYLPSSPATGACAILSLSTTICLEDGEKHIKQLDPIAAQAALQILLSESPSLDSFSGEWPAKHPLPDAELLGVYGTLRYHLDTYTLYATGWIMWIKISGKINHTKSNY